MSALGCRGLAEMMPVTPSRFWLGWPLASRRPSTVTLITLEFKRAMEAARYYDTLMNRFRAEPTRLRMDSGGIPRAVFRTLYE